MSNEELMRALGRLKVETGSLACLGCGHEHSCSTRGCAIIRAAEEALRAYMDTGRQFIGFEKDAEIFETATARIRAHLAEYPQEAAHERSR